ncbi:unnamed protein product [Calypogeia fissa]
MRSLGVASDDVTLVTNDSSEIFHTRWLGPSANMYVGAAIFGQNGARSAAVEQRAVLLEFGIKSAGPRFGEGNLPVKNLGAVRRGRDPCAATPWRLPNSHGSKIGDPHDFTDLPQHLS